MTGPEANPCIRACASLRKSLADRVFWIFVVLGWGTQWMVTDGLFQCFAIFDAELPGGLNLPQVSISLVGNSASAIPVIIWPILFYKHPPSERVYVGVAWAAAIAPAVIAFIAAVGWRVVVGNVAVIVESTVSAAILVGNFVYVAQLPMLAIYYIESCTAGVMLGSGLGSSFAGILGIIQESLQDSENASQNAFGPGPYMGVITVLAACSTVAWVYIWHEGIGRRPNPSKDNAAEDERDGKAEAACQGSTTTATPLIPVKAGGKTEHSKLIATPAGICDSYFVSVTLLGSIISIQTWGLTFLQFAAANASCTCDTADATNKRTFQLATALAFIAMPIGGLLSHLAPSYDLRVHTALVCLHILAFLFQTLAVAGAGVMTCSVAAQAIVILSNAMLRGVYQYLIALQYPMLARRYEGTPGNSERAVLLFGLITTWLIIVTTYISYALTETNVVSCPLH
uniref:Uncharacterized protein n=1 Tax=Haptolina brevifila TaxID=156173 RepID=A0A7S2H392_9EUKA